MIVRMMMMVKLKFPHLCYRLVDFDLVLLRNGTLGAGDKALNGTAKDTEIYFVEIETSQLEGRKSV